MRDVSRSASKATLLFGRSMESVIEIRILGAREARENIAALAGLLIDCVEGGASVGYMDPLERRVAESFFENVAAQVERGERVLLAAFDGGRLAGSVQVVLAMPPNQPHRGEISKLLVHRWARGQGAGSALMLRAEEVARGAGKRLLVLDTATGSKAEQLYSEWGWTKAGVIPDYALMPDGTPCDTTFFWKRLIG